MCPQTCSLMRPRAETYIMEKDVISLHGTQARSARELNRARTHRFSRTGQKPRVSSAVASTREFPMSTTMTGMLLQLRPGAIHEPH
jgi:oxalate decarboxylase